jgi:hypothetical protein
MVYILESQFDLIKIKKSRIWQGMPAIPTVRKAQIGGAQSVANSRENS